MAKTVVNLSDPIGTFVNKTNTISDDVGDLATLTTSLDSNLAGAINELDAELGTITAGAMGTTASTVSTAIKELDSDRDRLITFVEPTQALTTTATTLPDAINELDSDLGNRASLNTLNTTSIVAAVNSLFTTLSTIDSDATNNPVGVLSNLTTTAKNNVVAAVNEINGKDPTITLAGDLSGSATLTNLASATLTATIAANSVALGTDTTGNYIATVAAGEGIDVSGSGSETAAVTISAEDATASNKGIASFNSTDFSVSSGAVSLAKDPVITLTGAITGSGTMSNLGDVSIATTATSDPTITLTGDVTGSGTMTNLGNVSFAATIASGSITSSMFQSATSLQIKDAGGTVRKTIFTPNA